MGTRTRRAAAGVAAAVLLVAAPVAARPLMTKSEAVRIAKAVNLTVDDVPSDYKPSGPTNTRGTDLWGGKRFSRCSGRKALGRALADVESGAFERQSQGSYDAIGSEVEVMPTVALARKDIAIAKSARGRRCLLAELRASQPSDVKLISAKLTPLSPGIPGGVAMRLSLVVESQGIRFPFYTDVFVTRQRNVEAAVFFIGAPDLPKRSDEDKYIGIVQTRLDAQLNPNTIL
jgi:hypothetical protein